MPGMGGQQCLSKLLEVDPNVKVIVASGHFMESEAIDPVALGACRAVRKPFRADDLLTCIRTVLEQ